MTVDARAIDLRIRVGDDLQDWSDWYTLLEIGWESLDGGKIAKTGRLIIADSYPNPTGPGSINPLANPVRWRPGQPIRVSYWDGTAWLPHPLAANLVILEEPIEPSIESYQIEISIGCNLTYYDYTQPDDDQTGITPGAGENSAVVAQRLLEAGEVPTAQINLGSWPYDLTFPETKEGGSFVAQASDLAYANHQYLYCDQNNIVRSQELTLQSAAPVATITLGQDELKYAPLRDPQQPVELVRAVATSQQPEDEENPRTEYFPQFGDPGEILNDSSVGGYGVVASLLTEYFTQSEAPQEVFRSTYRELAGKFNQNFGSKIQNVISDRTTNSTYADENGRIYRERTVSSARRGVLNPNETDNVINEDTYFEQDIIYTYDAEDVVTKIETKERSAKIKVNIDEVDDPYTLVDSREIVQRWKEVAPGKYQQSTVDSICAIAQNPNGDYDNPYALITKDPVRPSADNTGSTQPPRTKYLEIGRQSKEVHLEGRALFEHPGGSTLRNRERPPYQVAYGFSEAQLNSIAYSEGYLLYGRRQGKLIELPITPVLLGQTAPMFRVDIADPVESLTFSYLMDAVEFHHEPERAWVEAAGIWIGTVEAGGIDPPFTIIPYIPEPEPNGANWFSLSRQA